MNQTLKTLCENMVKTISNRKYVKQWKGVLDSFSFFSGNPISYIIEREIFIVVDYPCISKDTKMVVCEATKIYRNKRGCKFLRGKVLNTNKYFTIDSSLFFTWDNEGKQRGRKIGLIDELSLILLLGSEVVYSNDPDKIGRAFKEEVARRALELKACWDIYEES